MVRLLSVSGTTRVRLRLLAEKKKKCQRNFFSKKSFFFVVAGKNKSENSGSSSKPTMRDMVMLGVIAVLAMWPGSALSFAPATHLPAVQASRSPERAMHPLQMESNCNLDLRASEEGRLKSKVLAGAALLSISVCSPQPSRAGGEVSSSGIPPLQWDENCGTSCHADACFRLLLI